MKKVKVKIAEAGQRLDKFLAGRLKISRAQAQKIIKGDNIIVDEKPVNAHYLVRAKEYITIHTPKKSTTKVKVDITQTLPKFKLEVVAKTKEYIVVNKPAGIPVHPDTRYTKGTLIDVVTKKYPEIKKIGEEKNRGGIIHRIDKDVSGLLVIPRTKKMFDHLKEQFKNRTVTKEYIALVNGETVLEVGKIDFKITRGVTGLMAARPHSQEGKTALTEYQVIQHFINYTLVKVIIKTGRTHQIRVHFKSLGHPLVGDVLYTIRKQKPDKVKLDRIFLHSQTLGFDDLDKERQEFHADLPKELKEYLTKIK